jgi:hypothetical protein
MALFGKFWDRIAPKPGTNRRDAEPATVVNDRVRSQIRNGDPHAVLDADHRLVAKQTAYMSSVVLQVARASILGRPPDAAVMT